MMQMLQCSSEQLSAFVRAATCSCSAPPPPHDAHHPSKALGSVLYWYTSPLITSTPAELFSLLSCERHRTTSASAQRWVSPVTYVRSTEEHKLRHTAGLRAQLAAERTYKLHGSTRSGHIVCELTAAAVSLASARTGTPSSCRTSTTFLRHMVSSVLDV